jgi:hypothetical protein
MCEKNVKEKQIITKLTNYKFDAMELERIIMWVNMGVKTRFEPIN